MSAHKIIHVGRLAFEKLKQESTKLIIIDFVAPHCSACKTLKPVLEQLAIKHSDRLHLVKIDTLEEPELTLNLEVKSVPTVLMFKGQQLVSYIAGLQPKKQYLEAVQLFS